MQRKITMAILSKLLFPFSCRLSNIIEYGDYINFSTFFTIIFILNVHDLFVIGRDAANN